MKWTDVIEPEYSDAHAYPIVTYSSRTYGFFVLYLFSEYYTHNIFLSAIKGDNLYEL